MVLFAALVVDQEYVKSRSVKHDCPVSCMLNVVLMYCMFIFIVSLLP